MRCLQADDPRVLVQIYQYKVHFVTFVDAICRELPQLTPFFSCEKKHRHSGVIPSSGDKADVPFK